MIPVMASRGRYQPQEWEREEFDNTFDAQYLDEETQLVVHKSLLIPKYIAVLKIKLRKDNNTLKQSDSRSEHTNFTVSRLPTRLFKSCVQDF